MLNFAHHYEYEDSGLNINDFLMSERRVMYDHTLTFKGYKWSGKSVLKKINNDELPKYVCQIFKI